MGKYVYYQELWAKSIRCAIAHQGTSLCRHYKAEAYWYRQAMLRAYLCGLGLNPDSDLD